MKNKNASKGGFTLVEILIAVLIIGVLMSIAVPMYQGSIDKSRWAKLLSPSRAIANAQEAMLMSQGKYTTVKEDLVVSLPNDGEYTYTLYTTENGDDGNFVRLESDKLEDVRLARYYEQDEKHSNHLYCEAKNGNARAKKLCEKLLGGAELLTTDDGYKAYFLTGVVTEQVCGKVDGWWSNNFNKCFSAEQERCTANGMPYNDSTNLCGYLNTTDPVVLREGGKCVTTAGSHTCKGVTYYAGSKCEGILTAGCQEGLWYSGTTCQAEAIGMCGNGTFEDGAVCVANKGESCASNYESKTNGGMNGSIFKSGSTCIANAYGSCEGTFEAGSICVANEGHSSCGSGFGSHSTGSTFKSGSICIANAAGNCNGTYDGGCCCGQYCPSGTRCAASACTSEYIQPW